MNITLLPADKYIVINETILNDYDKKILLNLYAPIIGSNAITLYLTLWSDLDRREVMSDYLTHHHLMTLLKMDLKSIKESTSALESMGLIKTYFKSDSINEYVYQLYSPLTPNEFFSHPILNVVLYNNIGKYEYEILKKEYEIAKFNLKDYQEITKTINKVFDSVSYIPDINARDKNTLGINVDNIIDFDTIISSIPKGIINEKTFNKKTKELINNLAFIYNFDTLKISEILRISLTEKGTIDKENLRKSARKYYQYSNGTLPTIIYRSQPEYLKKPIGDNSNRGKIIAVFENTSPYDFLVNKYKGAKPALRDLKLIEELLIDIELTPAVVNVLIDFVLKKNNNKLVKEYVETIAGQWKRKNIMTASDAMETAEMEHRKQQNKNKGYSKMKKNDEPLWLNELQEESKISIEEEQELKNLLKGFE